MNNQPYGRGFDEKEELEIAARKLAHRSGQREAESRERTRQILDYYTHGRAGKTWNN